MSEDFYLYKLLGNIEKDIVTTIYGPGGSGKTCSCMIVARDIAKDGGKVIYIDTEGGFSVERLKQISGDNYEEILDNITFMHPVNFAEQKRYLEKLRDKITDNVKIVIIDTIAMLYRLELGKNEDVYEINRELGRQLSFLIEIARKKNIPVLLTNQVYSNMENGVKMVGGDILLYGSKCLIEIVKGHDGKRRAILKKHRNMPENKIIDFKITHSGMNYSDH